MLWEDPEGEEKSVYMPVVTDRPVLKEGATDEEKKEAIKAYTEKILVALYNTEIEKQLKMDRYKTAKCTPSPLNKDLITEGLTM